MIIRKLEDLTDTEKWFLISYAHNLALLLLQSEYYKDTEIRTFVDKILSITILRKK